MESNYVFLIEWYFSHAYLIEKNIENEDKQSFVNRFEMKFMKFDDLLS